MPVARLACSPDLPQGLPKKIELQLLLADLALQLGDPPPRRLDIPQSLGWYRLLHSPSTLARPPGTPLTQARVEALAREAGAIVLCGRFEGVDERVIEGRALEDVSVGDYVLSGGEIAACTTSSSGYLLCRSTHCSSRRAARSGTRALEPMKGTRLP